jgi:hypothetical protein
VIPLVYIRFRSHEVLTTLTLRNKITRNSHLESIDWVLASLHCNMQIIVLSACFMVDKMEVTYSLSPKFLSYFFSLIAKYFRMTDIFIHNSSIWCPVLSKKHQYCTIQHKSSRSNILLTSLLHCKGNWFVLATYIHALRADLKHEKLFMYLYLI